MICALDALVAVIVLRLVWVFFSRAFLVRPARTRG